MSEHPVRLMHARYAPSASKRYLACAGSLTLERGLPDIPKDYTDEGTACHTVAAWCLTEHRRATNRVGDWIVVSHPPEDERKVRFTDEMAEHVQGYVDCVRFLAIGSSYEIEQRLEFSKFVGLPDQFGTTDAAFLDEREGELVVIDAKFGHVPVAVEKNPQLMTYALGTLAKMYEAAMRLLVEQADIADAMGAEGAAEIRDEALAKLDADIDAVEKAFSKDVVDDGFDDAVRDVLTQQQEDDDDLAG